MPFRWNPLHVVEQYALQTSVPSTRECLVILWWHAKLWLLRHASLLLGGTLVLLLLFSLWAARRARREYREAADDDS